MDLVDDLRNETSQADAWREELAQSLVNQRQRASEQFNARRQRFRQLEAELAERLAALSAELAREQASGENQAAVRESQATALREQAELLERQREELRQQRERWDQAQERAGQQQAQLLANIQDGLSRLDSRRAEIAAAERELHVRQLELAQLQTDLNQATVQQSERQQQVEQQLADLAAAQAALAEERALYELQAEELGGGLAAFQRRQAELQAQQEELLCLQHDTEKQRRGVGRQLKARKAELDAERELLKAEARCAAAGQDIQLQLKISELQGQQDRLRDEVARQKQQREEVAEKLAEAERDLQAQQAELIQQRLLAEQTAARQRSLESERERLAAERERLAVELSRAHTERERAIEDCTRLEQQCERLRTELAETRQAAERQLAESRTAQDGGGQQLRELQERIDELNEKRRQQAAAAAEREVDWDRQRKGLERKLGELEAGGAAASGAAADLSRLQEENCRLMESLRQLEARQLEAKPAPTSTAVSQELEDLRRRFEMAVHDCRELKTRNAELQEQVASHRPAANAIAGPKPAAAPLWAKGMDWATQKQRLLEHLESDFDASDERQQADKLTLAGAVRITDQVVAEKDRLLAEKTHEIEELRKLLENQSNNLGQFAVGASAIADMFNNDELIQQERANLQKIKQEMEEKLRRAEIDISMERAKLARERLDMEEKVANLEREKAHHRPSAADSAAEPGKKTARGNWFNVLGLGDKSSDGKTH